MPRFAELLKDTSPPLVFSEGWQGGFSETDPSLDQYSQASYTFTQTKGANMTFVFNGTFVGIYGAKRPGHGAYTIKLDDHVLPTFNGSSDVALFNQTLFNTTLEDGFHTITLINDDNTTLDVDYVYFEGQVGKQDEPLIPTTFQDNDPEFTYFPASAWTQSPRPGTFSGSTGTITSDPAATFEYKFEVSDVILLYGTVTPTSTSAYLISVDGGPFSTFSSRKASVRPHQVLYYAGNLGRGEHTLNFKFAGTNGTTGGIAIDFANLYSAPSLGAQEGLSNIVDLPSSSSRYIPKSIIAGLSVTSVLAFLALVLSVYLLWNQRRYKKDRKFEKFEDAGH